MADRERLTNRARDPAETSYGAPHTNGAVITSGNPKTRSFRRRLFLTGLVVFIGLWAFALTYSVTAGGRSPERLDDPTARTVESACLDAQHSLTALRQVGIHAPAAERAARISGEDAILTAMVGRLRALHPQQKAPAEALTGWLDDWQRLIAARQHFMSDLRKDGDNARFVEPATAGVDPVADKMNNWILEQGTRTNSCNTGQLQAEVVAGPRIYGPASNS